jgi:hypothetical protein
MTAGIIIYTDAKYGETESSSISPPPSAGCDYAAGCQQMIAPLYGNTTNATDYDRVNTASTENGGAAGFIIAANCSNSPCPKYDATLEQKLKASDTAGVHTVGYVYTAFADVPIDTVKADIDRWYSLYPSINGIFLDTASLDPADSAYYKELFDYIRAKGGSVGRAPSGAFDANRYDYVLSNYNSQRTPEVSMQYTDINVIFEGPYQSNVHNDYESFQMPPWTQNYSADRFNHIVYGVDSANLRNIVTLGKQRNAAYMFLSDNPQGDYAYQQLPREPYFTNEQNYLRSTSSGG